MARIALIDPSGRSTTTVQAVLGRIHEILVRSRIHAPGDCDLVIADLRYEDLTEAALLRSLGSFGPVLLLIDRLEPVPASVEESAALRVLRKPFDAFELRLNVERLLRAVSRQTDRSEQPARGEEEDAQWLEFPFVPAPAGAVLRRAAKLTAPLWILGEPGSGRRRVAMAVCRSAEPPLRVVTLFPDEQLAAVLERERDSGDFALFIPEIDERPLLEQERLALLLSGSVSFRLIATSVDDPGERVLSGAFSRNLYQHLIGLAVQLSPLRERPVTVPPLVQALTRRIGRRLGLGDDISFSPDAMARLQTYMWPGNIVELESVLNRSLVHLSDKDLVSRVIGVDDLLFMPDDGTRPRLTAKPSSLATVARLPSRAAQAAGAGSDEPRGVGSRSVGAPPGALDIRSVIAGLAHDLRNPMTTIKTFAGTLGSVASTGDEDVRRLGDLASEACARIDGYLEALQRYGEMGPPAPRACDLVSLARQAIESRAGAERMRARLAIDAPVPARCDPEQMVYVLENIVAALLAEGAIDAPVTVRAERGGLSFEMTSGRGPVAKLRALLEEGEDRAFTWRMLLAAAAAEKNGFVVEEEVAGDVLRVRCRPARGEVETRDEQAHRTDR